MEFFKPDCASALQRKRPHSLLSRFRRTLSPSPVSAQNTRNCGDFRRFSEERYRVSLQVRLAGGGRGIRTPGTLSSTAVFKTACFNRSHIPPHKEHVCFHHCTTATFLPKTGNRCITVARNPI